MVNTGLHLTTPNYKGNGIFWNYIFDRALTKLQKYFQLHQIILFFRIGGGGFFLFFGPSYLCGNFVISIIDRKSFYTLTLPPSIIENILLWDNRETVKEKSPRKQGWGAAKAFALLERYIWNCADLKKKKSWIIQNKFFILFLEIWYYDSKIFSKIKGKAVAIVVV